MKILPQILKTEKVPYRNKNVKIGLFNKAHEKEARDLYYAQDVIGNYAKANHSQILFQEAEERMNDPHFKDYLHIKIKKSKRTSDLYRREPDEAVIKYENKSSNKPFLRRVYEAVQVLTGDPMMPVEKHSRETYSKLVQSGKISL